MTQPGNPQPDSPPPGPQRQDPPRPSPSQPDRGPQRPGSPGSGLGFLGRQRPASANGEEDWVARWQRMARRIRVPLGFLTAALYLLELARRAPQPAAVAWSLALALPGLWLRAYAAGYVKKNRELTVTGPYAHTRNPLYLGSMLIAAGFALALLSWPVALLLALGFAAIYIPVIASEERFLRATFPEFEPYCRQVPRLIPRLSPAKFQAGAGSFSFRLYCKHREYNAAIGIALLYLSLLLLRPALRHFHG